MPLKGSSSKKYHPKDVHQILCITSVDFKRKTLYGFCELHILPTKSSLPRLKINSLQCRVYRVCVKGPGLDTWLEAGFQSDATHNPLLTDTRKRSLDYFENSLKNNVTGNDADGLGGELSIRLPSETVPLVSAGHTLRISIEFCLEKPQGGVQFVSSGNDPEDKDALLFTHKHGDGSRLWFPCIDSFSNLCTWKIEVTVEKELTAVCPGDLSSKVETPDGKRVTYLYNLNTPTAAPNIGIAIGNFEIHVDPTNADITQFCSPGLLPVMKHSVATVNETFEFYEELLSCRFPYSCYKQVFVKEAFEDYQSFASMTILSSNLFHSSRVIEQTYKTRTVMSHSLADQYFGCFVTMQSWCDMWLPRGISGYLTTLFLKKTFGSNYYKHYIWDELNRLCDYELNGNGLPPLYPSTLSVDSLLGTNPSQDNSNTGDNPYQQHVRLISSRQLAILNTKAHLVIRMIELRVGFDLLMQTLNKLLALATTASSSRKDVHGWSNCLVTTPGFLNTMSTVSGKDITVFVDQWVCHSGVANFSAKFNFNRKRNIIELEISQSVGKGCLKYVGPLVVSVQELDGSFNHTVQVEDIVTNHEIPCHSKSRRNKKKKIPLWTGEEVDMDLSATLDSDSPVLWLRLDPDMTWHRRVELLQPDYMWEYQLRYERHVTSQLEAVKALERFPTASSRETLIDTLLNASCFYPVRLAAADCLAKIGSVDLDAWNGDAFMIDVYSRMFSSNSTQTIPKFNDFSDFVSYFIQKHLPVSMSMLRTATSQCPPTVLRFILSLLKYNDNRFNDYSAGYYKSSLIDALSNTVSPALTIASTNVNERKSVPENQGAKLVFAEVVLSLNIEKVLPSYKFAVTCSCLNAIRVLQVYGHIPSESAFFWKYSEYGLYEDVRCTAFKCLVDFIKTEKSVTDLQKLLKAMATEKVPSVRHSVMMLLIENPPFLRQKDSPFNTAILVEAMWYLITVTGTWDSRLRCDAVDLYRIFWGSVTPSCAVTDGVGLVIDLKERKSTAHQSGKRSVDDTMGSGLQHKKRKTVEGNAEEGLGAHDGPQMTIESSSGSKLTFKLKPSDELASADVQDIQMGQDTSELMMMKKVKKKKKKKHKHKDKKNEKGDASTSTLFRVL